ncbi:MAG: phosphotransferase family protein [Deltaproteobacteria bacterium]|nr:phosphotransferase family protein [Deltaproteobacteria bacterium]
MSMQPLHTLEPALRRYFTARLGADEEVALEGPQRIAIGHSRAMLGVSVEARIDARVVRPEYVLRVEQGGVFGTDSLPEVRLMRALRGAGLPVAPVRWYERDDSLIGAPFFVMDRVSGRGENPGPGAVRECVQLLKRQHELDWQRAGLAFLGVPSTPRAATLAQIARWERIYLESRFLPVPLLDEAAAWLRQRAPTPERVVLVHADPGPGNFMYEGDTINAITDWEFAHLGDPDEDWVYMATIRGSSLSKEAWQKLFESEAGVVVSDEAWKFWDVFNQFKGACANLSALRLFADGVNQAPNMAAVGTSIHLLLLSRLAELIGQH